MDMIKLLPAKRKDFEDYYKIRCGESDIFWMGFDGPPKREIIEKVFSERLGASTLEKVGDKRIYMIKVADENVGFVQFSKIDEGLELGYSILDECRGKGYGSEALCEAVCLAKTMSNCLVAYIRDDNEASKRVIEKAGLKPTDEANLEFFKGTGEVLHRRWELRM